MLSNLNYPQLSFTTCKGLKCSANNAQTLRSATADWLILSRVATFRTRSSCSAVNRSSRDKWRQKEDDDEDDNDDDDEEEGCWCLLDDGWAWAVEKEGSCGAKDDDEGEVFSLPSLELPPPLR